MPWYAKQFADGRIALHSRGDLEEFTEVFEAFAKTRPRAALFSRTNSDRSVTIYLTPAAEEFAVMIQAAETDEPSSTGLTLLAGEPGDLHEARIEREGSHRARRAG
jgi:hypothetical protein